MFFNSLSYILFLCVAVVTYWLIPLQIRRWWLLLASMVFYGFWKIEFLGLIVFSAFVDFYVSLRIHDAVTPRGRKFWLWVSMVINLGLLLYFKYTYFVVDNIAALGSIVHSDWRIPLGTIILPLGISFYTFVSLSYTIDIYRRLLDPVRDFGLYLTYVMLWPHMIAGPILRGHELITQLKRGHRFSSENIVTGMKSIVTGLFLKVVLADQIAPLVNAAFSTNTAKIGGLDVWTMAFGFGFQIYFDFAGYSLIAIGSARLIGIHFPQNFDWPYLATSPRDFWKCWHITLSSWVRDYLYLPLSGARYRDSSDGGIDVQIKEGKASGERLVFALFLSWLIMGFWHGSSWTFAVWGLWHAMFIYVYRRFRGRFTVRNNIAGALLGWLFTIPTVMLGWISFRATTLTQAIELYSKILQPGSYMRRSFPENFYLVVFLFMAGILCCGLLSRSRHITLQNIPMRRTVETIVFSIMIYFVFIFLKPVNQFIYFQF